MEPYNLIENLVKEELTSVLNKYPGICHCEQCQADILALALNHIPPQYVTGTRGLELTRDMVAAKYHEQITKAVSTAINQVLQNPRETCKKLNPTTTP